MSILSGFRFYRLSIVISVCLFSLTTLPSQVYCDDWVFIKSYDDYTMYYNPSSVKIDREKKTITVWNKFVYTEKGKLKFIKDKKENNNPKYNDFHYTRILHVYDYKNWKYDISKTLDYSKSENVLCNNEYQPEMDDIMPGSRNEYFIKNLLKNYNIQR